eukprot:6178215-Pleurochrysis_carterae.AAC.1
MLSGPFLLSSSVDGSGGGRRCCGRLSNHSLALSLSLSLFSFSICLSLPCSHFTLERCHLLLYPCVLCAGSDVRRALVLTAPRRVELCRAPPRPTRAHVLAAWWLFAA